MNRRIALLAALLIAPGCRKAAEVPSMPSRLQQALQGLSAQDPCDRLIPLEWPTSWPVPTGKGGGREFKVFFYPLGGPRNEIKVSAPLGEAVFDADSGKPSQCRRLPGALTVLSQTRWGAKVEAMSMKELEARSTDLYAASEEMGKLYAAKAALSAAQRKKAEAYGRLFQDLVEPALRPYYQALNPDFWKWLAENGAPVLP